MKRLVFGPVPSRRLGFSLGVDLIPRKYCTFDCVYCQLGTSGKTEVERRSFYEPSSVAAQVIQAAKACREIDYISLSGSGEPTLNGDIGWVIGKVKEAVSIPVAVITNGSLLHLPEVRKDLLHADVVLPSLDAASAAVYEKINRPHPSLEFPGLLEGLRAFRRDYAGKVWLEIMLISDMNNDWQHIEILKNIVSTIAVDRVQLNTVARPPAEKTARAVNAAELLSIARFIGNGCEVIAGGFKKQAMPGGHRDWQESVYQMLQRRSLTLKDIVSSTGASVSQARMGLDKLVKEKKVRAVTLGRRRFYTAIE
jgi:wyosine [tRNA(Phe)-imidazoG37] synthetase (radical SAM superfamily)